MRFSAAGALTQEESDPKNGELHYVSWDQDCSLKLLAMVKELLLTNQLS